MTTTLKGLNEWDNVEQLRSPESQEIGLGMSSKCTDKKHILMGDVDEAELVDLINALEEIANKHSLSHFIVLESTPDSYHVYNLGVRTFKEQIEIVEDFIEKGLVDEYWKNARLKEWRFVLRLTEYMWKEAPELIGIQLYGNEGDIISYPHLKFFRDFLGADDLGGLDVGMTDDTSVEVVRYERWS